MYQNRYVVCCILNTEHEGGDGMPLLLILFFLIGFFEELLKK